MSVYLITKRNHYYDIRNSLPKNARIIGAVEVIEKHVMHILNEFNPSDI
jgi:hypothetical protein